MKRGIKRLFSFLIFYSGITWLFFRLCYRKRDRILVLLYHRVREADDPFEPAIAPFRFEQQLGFLKKNFQVVSVRQALRFLEEKKIPVRPLAVITFDDGTRDNFEAAYPILKKHSLPAAFFVAAGSVGNESPMWTSRVEALFRKTEVPGLTLETLTPPRNFKMGGLKERMKVCNEVKREMKSVPDSRRSEILKEIEEKTGPLSLKGDEVTSEMMSWDEVRLLAEDPLMEIGSHSLTHRMLARLPLGEVETELRQSKKILEEKTGKPVDFLSYPGNSYNEAVKAAALRAGYRAAFAVDHGLTQFGEDPFSLKRLHIENEPFPVFLGEAALVLPGLRAVLKRRKS